MDQEVDNAVVGTMLLLTCTWSAQQVLVCRYNAAREESLAWVRAEASLAYLSCGAFLPYARQVLKHCRKTLAVDGTWMSEWRVIPCVVQVQPPRLTNDLSGETEGCALDDGTLYFVTAMVGTKIVPIMVLHIARKESSECWDMVMEAIRDKLGDIINTDAKDWTIISDGAAAIKSSIEKYLPNVFQQVITPHHPSLSLSCLVLL